MPLDNKQPKSERNIRVSFSRTDSGLFIYHLFVWLNFNLWHNSQLITLPTQSCLVLYPFCANLPYSLIMWLIVSSLSPHNLHLQLLSLSFGVFQINFKWWYFIWVRWRYLFFFSLSFNFNLWSAGTAKSTILQVLFFDVSYYKVWTSGRD